MQEGSESDDSRDDEEEEEMLAAAALWAKGKNDPNNEGGSKSSKPRHDIEQDDGSNEKRGRSSSAESTGKQAQERMCNSNKSAKTEQDASSGGWLTPAAPVVYSLHITQLPYEISVAAVRNAFERKGCIITSIRFVYDAKGGSRTFRGVAFIDVADESSFKLALELDKSTLQGRKMNVRPTKTKTELASIVQRTKERLAANKIDADRSKKNAKNKRRHFSRLSAGRAAERGGSSEKSRKKAEDPRPKKKRRRDDRKSSDKSKATEKERVRQTSSSREESPSKGNKKRKGEEKAKLTKKEKAKKAAIIRARKGVK